MKCLVIISLAFLHSGLFASVGDRVHLCKGDHGSMVFVESNFIAQPMVDFETTTGERWTMRGHQVSFSKEIHGAGFFVTAKNGNQTRPINLLFSIHRPQNARRSSHTYTTHVTIDTGDPDQDTLVIDMSCISHYVNFSFAVNA